MFPKIVGFPPQIIHLFIGFSIINHPFWGVSLFFETHGEDVDPTGLVGGFSPTHLKNMFVKMGSSSPRFGVNIKNI